MVYGYARVSTRDQNLEYQIDALRAAGCALIFTDTISGAKSSRPGLDELLGKVQTGDTLIVHKLDRLGRSLKHLVDTVNSLISSGVQFRSLSDSIDTTTPQGRLVFHLFASLAEFERELIRERTQAGMAAARSRGRKGGRPPGLSKIAEMKAAAADAMYREGKLTVVEMLDRLQISRFAFYKYLRHRGVLPPKKGCT